jgi:hypothetical protein
MKRLIGDCRDGHSPLPSGAVPACSRAAPRSTVVSAAGVILLLKAAILSAAPAQKIAPPAMWRLEGVELAWTASLGSNRLAGGIASDPKRGVVYALAPAHKASDFRRCVEISSNGDVAREFKLAKYNMTLRTARLRAGHHRDLVSFTRWVGNGLVAADTNGNSLWTYPEGQGIDDVWPADLDNDGLDEVIVGFNGFTGLHVVDHRGKLLWKNRQLGNIDCVGAADLDGDGKLEVIASSRNIAVFKYTGERMADVGVPAGYYANPLRSVRLSDAEASDAILLTGPSQKFTAVRRDGTQAWEVELPRGPAVDASEVLPGKPWLATMCASLLIIDTHKGRIHGRVEGIGGRAELCWLPVAGESEPLLIVSTRQAIYGLRVTK